DRGFKAKMELAVRNFFTPVFTRNWPETTKKPPFRAVFFLYLGGPDGIEIAVRNFSQTNDEVNFGPF
ncbi:hypothetical protein, partial [Candidatus Villigracilis affinis]|uniref:hypothetical protein n=1 Tax=Candidatus Villigracilis affinis TaxID=3140682 RepID=UPI0031F09BDE